MHSDICLFKANNLTPKGARKFVREPPDHTGYEPTVDIPIGGSKQGIKNKKWQIHAIWI